MTAQLRGWGPPGAGPIVSPTFGRRGATAPGGFRVEVAPLFVALVDDLETELGEEAVPGWCWGRAVRLVRGSNSVWSNHSWALALDFNAPRHPLGASGTMSRKASAIARRYGMRWGGDYTGRKDEMHFEFMGTPADARRRVVALGDRPTIREEQSMYRCKQGDSGQEVYALQRAINAAVPKADHVKIDGDYGPATVAAVAKLTGTDGTKVRAGEEREIEDAVIDARIRRSLKGLTPATVAGDHTHKATVELT